MALFVIMGVAGCGKSTVGAALATKINAQFIDGDRLHPPENIKKMSAGQPLDDLDRAPWLVQIGKTLSSSSGTMIIACSALKRKYRDVIRKNAGDTVTFLHLAGARSLIEARMSARSGHFMPVSLLDSQFRDLDPLESDETCVSVNIDQGLDAIVTELVAAVKPIEAR